MNTDLWVTPQEFFDKYNVIYDLKIDVCANDKNHKCDEYFTKKQDGLKQEWCKAFWMNPPYGRGIGKWIKKHMMSTLNIMLQVFYYYQQEPIPNGFTNMF